MIKTITYKHVAHVVMLAFAFASLGNVHEFFASAGHDGIAAWSLAGALGAALVTISIMLTHIDREADTRAWATLAGVGVAVALLSGSLQAAVYLHTLTPLTAIMLGYGIPLIGEVALAFGVAAYEKAEARAAYRNVGVMVEGAVAGQLEQAIGTFDGRSIQKHVEGTINRLAKRAVNHVSSQAARHYDTPKPTETHQISTDEQPQPFEPEQQNYAESAKSDDIASQKAAADAVRSDGKAEAMQRTLDFFRMHPDASLSDAEEYVGRKKSTIGGYLDELQATGKVYVNGSVEVTSI